MGKGTCLIRFDPRDPQGESREPTHAGCSLAFICVHYGLYIHTHTHDMKTFLMIKNIAEI